MAIRPVTSPSTLIAQDAATTLSERAAQTSSLSAVDPPLLRDGTQCPEDVRFADAGSTWQQLDLLVRQPVVVDVEIWIQDGPALFADEGRLRLIDSLGFCCLA
ncbi:hypothetical protein C3941_21440 [Kaistia algarum]|nr:hypothetical protein C3941_21440 [Kaistia algarum]